jgi:hypothetical protein
MANAMEILGDHEIIYKVFEGSFLEFYKSDDETAVFLKKYINQAVARAQKYHEESCEKHKDLYEKYRLKRDKWYKKGMNGEPPIYPYSHYIDDSIDFVRLKVNHYRQKFWYWKKLKE